VQWPRDMQRPASVQDDDIEPRQERRAFGEDLRGALGAAPGAGSDAHSLGEIGSVYVEMEEFEGAEDFLAKLRRSKIVKHRHQLLLAAEAMLRHTMSR